MIQLINGKTIIHEITESQNHIITLHSTASSCSKLHSAGLRFSNHRFQDYQIKQDQQGIRFSNHRFTANPDDEHRFTANPYNFLSLITDSPPLDRKKQSLGSQFVPSSRSGVWDREGMTGVQGGDRVRQRRWSHWRSRETGTKTKGTDEDEVERQGRRRKRRGRLLGHSGGICEFGKEKRLLFTATVACCIYNFPFAISHFGLRRTFC